MQFPTRPVIRVTVITGIAASLIFGPVGVANAEEQKHSRRADTISAVSERLNALMVATGAADASREEAERELAESDGHVLSETHRSALRKASTGAATKLRSAQSAAKSLRARIRAAQADDALSIPTGNAAKHLARSLTTAARPLPKMTEAVATDVSAWKAEQARKAAEAKAAAQASAAAAAAAAEAHEDEAARQSAAVAPISPAPAPTATASTGSAGTSTAPASVPSAAAPAPAPSKLAIAQSTFARFGFSNVVYDSGASQGHYGATDLNNQVIYLQLSIIPTDRVASVAIHEYMHIIQARTYGGYEATVAHFGSVLGMERAADQMARSNGATWTNY